MMKCHACRAANMRPHRGPYRYDASGLPYPVILRDVSVQRCPNCNEENVTIPDLEGLHRTLGLSIVSEACPLLPEEVRFLRKLLDWTADEMAKTMGVDAKTISRWENGKQRMGPVAERLLRLIVRDLEPRSPEWISQIFPGLETSTKKKPAKVTLKATRAGWRKAA